MRGFINLTLVVSPIALSHASQRQADPSWLLVSLMVMQRPRVADRLLLP